MLPANSGGWRLDVADGAGHLAPAGADGLARLHVRGWSILWCGAGRAAHVRQAGLLTGGDPQIDGVLDATLGAGGATGILDYF